MGVSMARLVQYGHNSFHFDRILMAKKFIFVLWKEEDGGEEEERRSRNDWDEANINKTWFESTSLLVHHIDPMHFFIL